MRSASQNESSILNVDPEPDHCKYAAIPGMHETLCALDGFQEDCSHSCWAAFHAAGVCLDSEAAGDLCALVNEDTHALLCAYKDMGDLCCATCESYGDLKPACEDTAEQQFQFNLCAAITSDTHTLFCAVGMVRDACCASCSHHNTTSTTTTTTTTTTPRCIFDESGRGYIQGCAGGKTPPCDGVSNYSIAISECAANPSCGGVTYSAKSELYEFRAGRVILPPKKNVPEFSFVCSAEHPDLIGEAYHGRCDYYEAEGFLKDCALGKENKECIGSEPTLDAALAKCGATPNCGGVTTRSAGVYELRVGANGIKDSRFGEVSWVCGPRRFGVAVGGSHYNTCEEGGAALITDINKCYEAFEYLGAVANVPGFELKNETLPIGMGIGCRAHGQHPDMEFNFHYEAGWSTQGYNCSHTHMCICDLEGLQQ